MFRDKKNLQHTYNLLYIYKNAFDFYPKWQSMQGMFTGNKIHNLCVASAVVYQLSYSNIVNENIS